MRSCRTGLPATSMAVPAGKKSRAASKATNTLSARGARSLLVAPA